MVGDARMKRVRATRMMMGRRRRKKKKKTTMTARGEVSGPQPPQAGRITGSRTAMASGTHGELVTGGAGATLEGRAATRTGPASSDIPRDRNAREIQGAVLSSLFALKKKKKKSPAPLTNDHETSISSSHSQRDSILRRTFFFVFLNSCSYFEKKTTEETDLYL